MSRSETSETLPPKPIHPLCSLVADALLRIGYERGDEIVPGIVEFVTYEPQYNTVALPMGAYADANDLLRTVAEQHVDMVAFVEQMVDLLQGLMAQQGH